MLGFASFAAACLAVSLLAAPAMAGRPAPPPNDDFKDAIAIRVGDTVRGTLRGAAVQRREARYFHDRDTRVVWYRLRARRDELIDVNICGAKFASELAVFSGRSLGSLRQLRYQEGGCKDGFGIALRARGGRTYSIGVAGADLPSSPLGSGRFRLRVASIPTPPNDDFADALPLRLGSTRSGTTAGSTGEPGEPRRCCGVLHTVWYRLRVAAAAQVRLHACSDGSPFIAVYTGRRVDRLTQVAFFRFCVVEFAAKPGVTYHVAVDDRNSWSAFRLSAFAGKPPPNDDFARATAIALGTTVSGSTSYASREPGEPIGSAGLPAPFTVWYRLAVVAPTVVEVAPSCGLRNRAGAVNVYTGEQLSELREVSKQLSAPEAGPCAFRFEAVPGIYNLRVEAGVFEEGEFELTTRSVEALQS